MPPCSSPVRLRNPEDRSSQSPRTPLNGLSNSCGRRDHGCYTCARRFRLIEKRWDLSVNVLRDCVHPLFTLWLQEVQVPESRNSAVMSQQGNSSPTQTPTPNVGKGARKGIGAVLVLLVSLGAFAGAAAGTYVTFAYIILPHLTGSNGSNNNNNNNGGNNSCTTNCGSGGGGTCGTGCLQGVITGNSNPSSPYVKLDQVNATSSTNLSFTIEAVGATSLNGNSITVTDTTTSFSSTTSCPSGQTCTVSNSPNVNQLSATGSLTFKTGDTYTMQFSDSGNPSTYNFHF